MKFSIEIIMKSYGFDPSIRHGLEKLADLEKSLSNYKQYISIDLTHAAAIISRYSNPAAALEILYNCMDTNLNKKFAYIGSILDKLAKKEKITFNSTIEDLEKRANQYFKAENK